MYKMMKYHKNCGKRIFQRLPHDFRRGIFCCIYPQSCKRMQVLARTKGDYGFAVFRQYKCIFVHIPKTAGVAISSALFDGALGGGHRTIRYYQMVYKQKEFDSFFKFSFVRNPWARLYSAYNFLKKGGMDEYDRKWASENLAQYKDFNDFVCGWLSEENIFKKYHFFPQSYFLCDFKGKILVDFVGRFESINKDFEYICNKIDKNATLLPINVSEHKDYRVVYNDDSRKVVARLYAEDIEYFGYSFGK